jgi:hypothetical protein
VLNLPAERLIRLTPSRTGHRLQALAACEEASEEQEAQLQGQLAALQERREALLHAGGALQQVVAQLQEQVAPLATGGRAGLPVAAPAALPSVHAWPALDRERDGKVGWR